MLGLGERPFKATLLWRTGPASVPSPRASSGRACRAHRCQRGRARDAIFIDDAAPATSWMGPKVGFDEIGAALDLNQRSAAWTALRRHRKTIVLQGDDDAFALKSSDDLGGAPRGGEGQLGSFGLCGQRVGPDYRFQLGHVPSSNRASCISFRSGLPAKRSHGSPTRGVPLHTAQAKLCRGLASSLPRATQRGRAVNITAPAKCGAHGRDGAWPWGSTTRPAPGEQRRRSDREAPKHSSSDALSAR